MRKFWERGRRVVKRFMDDTANTVDIGVGNSDRFNVFWANVGVLKASLYAVQPSPLVKREFDDYQDDVARVAALMLERLLKCEFEGIGSPVSSAFAHTVEDRLIPGLGSVWLRYEPEIEEIVVQEEMRRKNRVVQERIINETIKAEYACVDDVYWEDFLFSPARTWEEVRWVARRVWMTKREFTKRFGKQFLALVSWVKKSDSKLGERVTPENTGISKTEVFEIWNLADKCVYWISKDCAYILDIKADPLELECFWPCPKPLLATTTTSNLVPKADYLMVQSQYARLDNLARRIGMLEDAIQASGVYDKANKELGQILSGVSNKMIPVDNWAMFAEKGGIKGVVDWFPIEMVVNALDKLRDLFREAQAQLYELTGISDIMRGVTSPRETAAAQGLKAQYSSVRLQYLQGEVAEFIQRALQIRAEIICKHFQIQSIIEKSLILLTPDAEHAMAAAQLLKDVGTAHYRIHVYADTLAIPDYNAERQGRIEFITAVGQFISQSWPLVQQAPQAGVFLMQILQWGIASFRSANSIEGVFDKAAKAIEDMIKQQAAAPPKKDPKQLEAEATIAREDAKAKATISRDQAKQQSEQQRDIATVRAQAMQDSIQARNDTMQTQNTIELERERTQAEIENNRRKTVADIQVARLRARKGK
jgi:hypothetical protein